MKMICVRLFATTGLLFGIVSQAQAGEFLFEGHVPQVQQIDLQQLWVKHLDFA